jgi:hypothetical protein
MLKAEENFYNNIERIANALESIANTLKEDEKNSLVLTDICKDLYANKKENAEIEVKKVEVLENE